MKSSVLVLCITKFNSFKQQTLFHSGCGSGIWEGLSGWVWFRVSNEVAVKLSAETAVV